MNAKSTEWKKVGKVTTESVFKHTGKHWDEWFVLLDKARARSWTHQEIVAYLKTKHQLSPWWQQGVALGFEIAIGRRRDGQDAQGRYMVTATKSLSQGPQEVWKTLVSAAGQEVWLKPYSAIEIHPKTHFETADGYFGEVRTIATARRIRLYWQDPLWERHTVVEVLIVPRAEKKSVLVFNHTGIQTAKIRMLLQTRWRQVADEIPILMVSYTSSSKRPKSVRKAGIST